MVRFSSDDALVASPDRKSFFTIIHRGEISTDSVVYEIDVYSVDQVRQAIIEHRPPPVPVVKLIQRNQSSDDETGAIWKARWSDDGQSIVYLARDDDGWFQAHRLSIGDGRDIKLTNHPGGLFDFIYRSGVVVYISSDKEPFVRRDRFPSYPGGSLLGPYPGAPLQLFSAGSSAGSSDLYVQRAGDSARRLDVHQPGILRSGQSVFAAISPDGRRLALRDASPSISCGFQIVDLETGRRLGVTYPACAPRSAPTTFFWTGDSEHLVMREQGIGNDGWRRVRLVDLDTGTMSWRAIRDLDASTKLYWDSKAEVLEAVASTQGAASFALRYCQEANEWRQRTAAGTPQATSGRLLTIDGVEVALDQDANRPPRITAKFGGRKIDVLDPNPQLSSIRRVIPEWISWKEGDRHVEGILWLPQGASASRAVPVIIRADVPSDFKGTFMPDGNLSSYSGIQELAAAGIAVLSIPYKDIPLTNEGVGYVERLHHVIDVLAARRDIDVGRIALWGFSRAGYQTMYSMTHPDGISFAAGMFADSYTGDLTTYMFLAAIDDNDRSQEAPLGGTTPWQNRQAWIEHDTLMNFDRLNGPVLFTTHLRGIGIPFRSTDYAPDVYDGRILMTIGALRRVRRPFDYYVFPRGPHNLQRPREQLALINLTVDWFRFWLLGAEDSSSQKAEQYNRWRQLRSDWRNQQAWEAAGHPVGSQPASVARPN
jgi:dipeptidyl aminopeptidase/acylaminoacyl peptidase